LTGFARIADTANVDRTRRRRDAKNSDKNSYEKGASTSAFAGSMLMLL